MSAIVIYGHQGSGKTSNAQAFLDHYGKKNVVDEWGGESRLADDDLALTNLTAISLQHPYGHARRYAYIPITAALEAIKSTPSR